MARAKTPESLKKTGDVMEPLIERTDADTDERRNGPSDDDEDTFERDSEDEDPEDSDDDE